MTPLEAAVEISGRRSKDYPEHKTHDCNTDNELPSQRLGRGRRGLGKLRRAIQVRQDDEDCGEKCPGCSPGESKQRQPAARCRCGGYPPELALKQRRGFGSR